MTEKLTPEEKAARKAARQAAVTSRRTNATERDRYATAAERFNKRSTTASVEDSLEDSAMTADEYQVALDRKLIGPESDTYGYVDRPKGDRTDAVPEEPRIDGPDMYQRSNAEIIADSRLDQPIENKIEADTWEEFKVDEADKDEADRDQEFRVPDQFEPVWHQDYTFWFFPGGLHAGELVDWEGQRVIDDRPEWDERPLDNDGKPIDGIITEWDH
jgi:hypothetical protein